MRLIFRSWSMQSFEVFWNWVTNRELESLPENDDAIAKAKMLQCLEIYFLAGKFPSWTASGHVELARKDTSHTSD